MKKLNLTILILSIIQLLTGTIFFVMFDPDSDSSIFAYLIVLSIVSLLGILITMVYALKESKRSQLWSFGCLFLGGAAGLAYVFTDKTGELQTQPPPQVPAQTQPPVQTPPQTPVQSPPKTN